MTVGPDLLWRWLAARSIAHGLPLPVPDGDGMRVDTRLPHETRRHVFAGPGAGLHALAATVREPRVFLKMCGSGDDLLALAPSGWELQPPGYFMTTEGGDAGPVHAPGYRIETMRQGLVTSVRIRAADGTVAASGHAAEFRGVFVFDRIATHAEHRRRGLGRALMAALDARRQSPDAQRVLVATAEGRALYEALGWTVASPYSTIVIPG